MDDRITEIRKALRWWDRMKDSTKWRPAIPVAFDAAQELVDLLDSDALIIRRDENGEWAHQYIEAVARRRYAHKWGSDESWERDTELSKRSLLAEAKADLDALASSQGVEPDRGPIPYMMFGETLDEAQKRIEGVEPQ